MQRRVTAPGPLHDEQGHLIETGYATELIKDYDRKRVAAPRFRVKEWDYYCVTTDHFALALTVADNGYLYMDSISLLDFDENKQATKSAIRLPNRKRSLPPTSKEGDIRAYGKDYEILFVNDGTCRRLFGQMEHFPTNAKDAPTLTFDLTLTDTPKDSMVIITPFADKPKAFYYNQKINCLRAEGFVTLGGKRYTFSPDHDFAVLDWGRGVWTYDNTWYWGSASGLAEGVPFGFNIGYGFGDTSAASENMLFYDGQAHKLSQVKFEIPLKDGKEDYLSPWKFTSDDGHFQMDFEPIMDRSAKIDFKLLLSDQHQVFGRFTGDAVLDDGRTVHVENLTGFAEKVHNRW